MIRAVLLAVILLAQARGPAQIVTGAISGRLLSPNGSPAAGVRVAATPVPDTPGVNEAPVLIGLSQTDAAGRYLLDGVPPGRYYILAGLIDYPSYYPGTTALANASSVEVASGETASNIDFALARPVAIRVAGRVIRAATLSPSSPLTVTLAPRNPRPGGNVFIQSQVDSSGSFAFPQVLPGDYTLSSPTRGSSTLQLSVADQDLDGLVVTVIDCNAGAEVRGKLSGTASSPVRTIGLNGSRFNCAPLTTVESDGSFLFRGVPEGVYAIQLAPAPPGWAGASVTVEREAIASLEVTLPPNFEVRGRLVVEDGSEPPRLSRNAPIPIQALSGVAGRTPVIQTIEDDGAFALRLVSGSYRISASAIPRDYYVKSIRYGSLDLTLSNLDLHAPPTGVIEIVLGFSGAMRPGVRVSGRVIPPAGGALAKTEGLTLSPSSGGRYAPVIETAVASDGSFEFRGITPGSYDLQTVPDSPVSLRNIGVNRSDVTGIEFALPVLYKVHGVIEWVAATVAASIPPQPVSIQFLKTDMRDDSSETGGARVWSSLGHDGAFQAYLPEGDYRFSITGVPARYGLDAATFNSVNLLTSDLPVRSTPEPLEIRVLLREKN
jgi:hypothetical protein